MYISARNQPSALSGSVCLAVESYSGATGHSLMAAYNPTMSRSPGPKGPLNIFTRFNIHKHTQASLLWHMHFEP